MLGNVEELPSKYLKLVILGEKGRLCRLNPPTGDSCLN